MRNGRDWGEAGDAKPCAASGEQIQEQLERVLASPAFRASKRCQDILRFMVRMTLEGRASEIKERTIGMDVLGRPSSYDPSVDATVRVKTGDIRRRLSLYYATASACDRVLIEVPAGSYVPVFRELPQPGGGSPPEKRVRSRRLAVAGLAGIVLTAALVLALWAAKPEPDPVLRQFWGPALRSTAPALLCLSYVPVYWPKPSVEASGREPSFASDFLLRSDSFVGADDSAAAFSLESVLRRLGGRTEVKIGNEVAFTDFRSSPALLIGYSYTRWRELNGDLRYLIDTSAGRKGISDRGQGARWILQASPDGGPQAEDYAVVARTFNPDTGNMLVLLAGVGGYGTRAAADLITTEKLIANALSSAPRDWNRRNLELVLHVKVISGATATPAVVASHYW